MKLSNQHLRQLHLPHPSGGGSGGSSGGSSGSSSSGGGSGSGGSGGSGGSSGSGSGGSSGGSASHSSGPLSRVTNAAANGGAGFWVEAAVAGTGIGALVFFVFFLIPSFKKKHKRKRNLEYELRGRNPSSDTPSATAFVKMVDAHVDTLSDTTGSDSSDSTDLEALRVAPVPNAGISGANQATSGVYATQRSAMDPTPVRGTIETRIRFAFTPTTNSDSSKKEDLRYKLSGNGYQTCYDSHMDAISITIVDGYSSLDGKVAWWLEERKPYTALTQPKTTSVCPRPRCTINKCKTSTGAVGGIPQTFSVDGAQTHIVKCQGKFDFESNTFKGKWSQHKGNNSSDRYDALMDDPQQPTSGKYLLSLLEKEEDEDSVFSEVVKQNHNSVDSSSNPRKQRFGAKALWSKVTGK